MKKFVLPAAIVLVLTLAVVAFIILRPKSSTTDLPQAAGKRQIINALPIKDRPFLALVPHSTNRLLTLFFDKPGVGQNISLDIEYLSGNSLKGGRTSVTDLSNLPYATAFLLGSCSTGGKCSFDTDITTGTLKTALEIGSELHILKSNFVFVGQKESTTSDQKLSFLPTGKSTGQLILSQTHGYLGTLDQEAAAEPAAITSTSESKITGTLSIYAPEATSLVYYDGEKYLPLTAEKKEDRFVVTLNLTPWSKTVDITRDDEKGSKETTTLFILGPIVPVK
jgi:hypothetical protein